jgi:hypothetical protein
MSATVIERHLFDDEIVASKCLTLRCKCGDKRKAPQLSAFVCSGLDTRPPDVNP